jgi:hypothetical protein
MPLSHLEIAEALIARFYCYLQIAVGWTGLVPRYHVHLYFRYHARKECVNLHRIHLLCALVLKLIKKRLHGSPI